jgi:hypothetical protein
MKYTKHDEILLFGTLQIYRGYHIFLKSVQVHNSLPLFFSGGTGPHAY